MQTTKAAAIQKTGDAEIFRVRNGRATHAQVQAKCCSDILPLELTLLIFTTAPVYRLRFLLCSAQKDRVIDSASAGVTEFKLGDRVAYSTSLGAYAAARLMDADKIVSVPKSIPTKLVAASLLHRLAMEYLIRRLY